MATVAYLTLAEFKALTLAPASTAGGADYIAEIEASEPGWTDAQLLHWSAWIDSRLAKRYATPFVSPYPLAAQAWLARIVTLRVYYKRGVNPDDEQLGSIERDVERVLEEIREAADAEQGLFNLPLRADTDSTGISRGDPLGYAEASPYKWTTEQRDAADLEG